MLTQLQVDWVVQLLDDKRLSQRTIARLTGVSRGTIGAIARGVRPQNLCRRESEEPAFDRGLPVRCHGCGGLVQMPCLLCRVRRIVTIERRLACLDRAMEAATKPGEPQQAASCLL